MRNATLKFKEKYQNKALAANRPSDSLATRRGQDIAAEKLAMNATWTKNGNDNSRSAKKIQTINATRVKNIRHMQIKSKESLETFSTSSVAFKRYQPAHKAKEYDQQSETQISSIKWKLKQNPTFSRKDPQDFIDSLPRNALFYCCECYQYVFQIEKKRHFPDCRDRVDVCRENRESFTVLGWERLQKLVELSAYTGVKSWQVQQLYLEVINHDFSKIYNISYPTDSRFFNLDQILLAFALTYERLLRGTVFKKMSIFTCF